MSFVPRIALLPLLTLLPVSMPTYSQDDDLSRSWQAMHEAKTASLERFNNAKFGMFIHWGVYSLPAGVWKGERIPGLGEWIFYHAKIPRAEYRALCREFNPVKFDAEAWVRVAKMAGMRYIVAMPKHHDGFAMYDSAVTDYDIIDAAPFKRDPIQELYEACQKAGLEFGIYYSHAVDWMDGGDAGVADALKDHTGGRDKWTTWPANTWDPAPVSFTEYLENKAKPQMRELLEKLPNLMEIWYDVPRYMTAQQSYDFYKLAYDLQPQCLINSRVGNGFGDYWVPGDNKIPAQDEGADMAWETPGTLNNTWGYKSYDVDWKSAVELLYWILEIASKGGNYLLNVGPMADGTIPVESTESLRRIGDWMHANGEAIYGTHRWKVTHEGPTNIQMTGTTSRERHGFDVEFTSNDIWFTARDDYVYASGLVRPRDGRVEIVSLGRSAGHLDSEIKSISVLGYNGPVKWEQTDEMLVVNLPNARYRARGFAIRIHL